MDGMTLTNQQVGSLIGVTHSAASRLLTGDRTPSIPTMKRIAKAFGVPLETVLQKASQSEDNADRCRLWGEWFRQVVNDHAKSDDAAPAAAAATS